MEIFTIPKILNWTAEGDRTGAWVGESKYVYSFFRTDKVPDELAFIIDAKLNLEFDAGGSIEYLCRVSHIFTKYQSKPMLMDYIILAEKTAEILNDFFLKEDLIDKGTKPWVNHDTDFIAEKVSGKQYEFYKTF